MPTDHFDPVIHVSVVAAIGVAGYCVLRHMPPHLLIINCPGQLEPQKAYNSRLNLVPFSVALKTSERSITLRKHLNRFQFRPRLHPRPHWGAYEVTTLPMTPWSAGRGIPYSHPLPILHPIDDIGVLVSLSRFMCPSHQILVTPLVTSSVCWLSLIHI